MAGRITGLALIALGLALAAWPVYNYVYAMVNQAILLREAETAAENPVLVEPGPIITKLPDEPIPVDKGPFVIHIPKLNVKAAVVHGVEPSDLAIGPGFYPNSPMPGQIGNVAVAGHRTTYGAWFRGVGDLVPGDEIVFTSPTGTYTYEVEDVFVVAANAWEVVDPTTAPKLTLTTCHPPGSDRERLVVRAGLTGFQGNTTVP